MWNLQSLLAPPTTNIRVVMAEQKQQQMKAEIASFLAKKDYYQILGVPKSAADPDIKKAYRNLALRFHPDKNQVEGAKEVFKKVSHAYSVLIDPDKKQHYDRFGPEGEQQRAPNRRNNSQEDYQYYQANEFFRHFFEGGVPEGFNQGPHFRTFSYTFGGNQGQGPRQRQGGFNFSILFLVIVVVYTFAPLFKSGPSFSRTPSSEHRFKVQTSVLHVEFYASQSYFQEVRDPHFKRQSEMLVDREYLSELEKMCEAKKKEKKRWQETAYRESPGARRENYLVQAKSVDLGSCRTISDITELHEDYIRDLTYMK